MNTQLATMTASELFIIKTALHLLAEKAQLDSTVSDNDFNAIAELEKSVVIAYQEKVVA